MYYIRCVYIILTLSMYYMCALSYPQRKNLNNVKQCRLFSTHSKININKILENLKENVNKNNILQILFLLWFPGGISKKEI